MELIWAAAGTVTIPNVGTVRQGDTFSIEDDRGKDLLQRKLAIKPLPVKKKWLSEELKGIDAAPEGKE